MYFNLEHLVFRYRPFPIGCARPLMEAGLYRAFLDNYPPLEIFENIPKLGSKYSLSERYNAGVYADFVASRPLWRDFRDWLKSDAFVDAVLAALKARGLDLGYKARAEARRGPGKIVKDLGRGRLWSNPQDLTARFEFSMLPADGGHILPHTDTPEKVITLIVSMLGEGEWDPAFGGGTEVNRPRDPAQDYNWLNRQGAFEDMEVLDSYPFEPNQAVVFVKTHNSWHCVRPMTGQGSKALRRTLTINIEREA